jgi:4-hydroxy-tetrahydrodipicolinate synthase
VNAKAGIEEVRNVVADELTLFCMAATPFSEDLVLDESALRDHLRRLVKARNGIYLGSGGAGEGHVLTPRELRRIYEIGVEEAKGKVPVYANPRESRSAALMYEVAKEAVEANVDVVQIYQVDAGHGMIPTQREQDAYFTELLSEINHPVAISIHLYAGYAATPEYLRELCARFEQICAINVMGPPNSYFMALRDELPERIKLYTSIINLLHVATLGASGALLAENNVIPKVCQNIADAYQARDLEKMSHGTRTVQRFANVVNQWAPSTARWVKMALKVLGLGNGVLRPPYLLPPQEDQARMAAAFEALRIREEEGIEVPVGHGRG